MGETEEFVIGAMVVCTDGVGGELRRVVVDPVARAVTHLVVEPEHRSGLGRLVPIELVEGSTPSKVSLSCKVSELDKLDLAEQTHFLPASSYAGYGPGQALLWPYYGLGGGMGTGNMGVEMGLGMGNMSEPVVTDSLPAGEVAVRRGDQVHATDGAIGHVQGLVIDPKNHQVTHVLLQKGHLWGKKQVAIPIKAVRAVDGGIQLSITKQQVQDLPAVDLEVPESIGLT
ncbi:MAG: PRC-barrel domain-containing protein [Actinobacteria bacterium]|nr:PRC-barrel domain-containing protein [Actinomycetota bacterium]